MSEILNLIHLPDGRVVNETGHDPAVERVTGFVRYFVGADLGQANDYSSAVVVKDQQLPIHDGNRVVLGPRERTVVFADKFRGVSYVDVVDYLIRLRNAPPFGGNRRTVAAITQGGGDYCLASKANRDSLLSDARSCFGMVGADHPVARLEEVGHGRKKTRTATAVSARGLAEHHEFPGLKAFGRIGSRRDTDARVQTEARYFTLSRMPDPEALLATVRAHWSIENALHWQLDVSFREDAARNRKDHGPANIAILRRRALDIARRDTSKGSLSIKLKRAGWSDTFLLSLLNQLVTS